MTSQRTPTPAVQPVTPPAEPPLLRLDDVQARAPLSNYSLSTVCPGCGADTFKLACKVRCARCGFMWDCSEL